MHDLIIIGSGPAGLTAGLYAARYRLKTLILEKLNLGGQIMLSPSIENFPGFPGGISTQELIDRFKKQIDELGVKIEMEEVSEVSVNAQLKTRAYNIGTKDKSYQARAVIIAAGAQPKRLSVEGETRLIARGVSYCGTCDGPLFRNKEIVVIGGGDRAFEEALFLTAYAKKVTVIHRRQAFRASRILEEKARAHPKINFLLDSIIEEVLGKDKVEAVRIRNVKTGSESALHCQGVFVFIGINPNTAFLNGLLDVDGAGFIITDEELKTSKDGIFACGDCRKKSLYQVITACADGAIAAASCQRYLLMA